MLRKDTTMSLETRGEAGGERGTGKSIPTAAYTDALRDVLPQDFY